MSTSLPRRLLTLVASLAALPALGQEEAAPAPTYPLAVALRFDPEARRASLQHHPADGFAGPRNPDATIPLGDQAFTAYTLASSRMFAPAQPGPAGATLRVLAVAGRLRLDPAGWRAEVEHQVALLDTRSGDREVARWSLAGEERVEGLGPGALPLAFSRAAKRAAARLEAGFGEPPPVAAWLAEQGVAATHPPPPAPAPLAFAAALPADPSPRRGDRLKYVDLAVRYDGASTAFGVSGRAGYAGRWWFVQGGLGYLDLMPPWPSSSLQGTLRVLEVGVEAGAAVRVYEPLEVRAAAGLAWASANLVDVDNDVTSTRVYPVLCLGGLYSMGLGSTGRVRLGLQARKALNATVSFDLKPAYQYPVSSDFRLADLAVELLAGYEWP